MNIKLPIIAALFFVAACSVPAEDPSSVGLRLARELADAGDPAGAALEYRRLALSVGEPSEQAGFFWAAAQAYHQSGAFDVSERMLDRAQDAGGDIDENAVNLLRGENAWARRKVDEAEFFYRGLAERAEDEATGSWAGRRLASAYLMNRQVTRAEEALRDAPGDQETGLEALAAYAEGKDKSPKLGGWLGLIPGLGYAYAGEYANALRSLILNSIFIFGMVDTAGDEEWGAFAAITFFEITWYSGSIYGGIDASHRYNRDRLQTAVRGIQGDGSWRVEVEELPLVSLRFSF